jgi:REP element-mobilizing transposase RayT
MPYNPILHHRRTIRLQGYDYSQSGMYFVTICCQNRQCVFGEIENGEMMLNENGEIVCEELVKSAEIRNEIEIREYVVMPNHVHVIAEIVGANGIRPNGNDDNGIRPNGKISDDDIRPIGNDGICHVENVPVGNVHHNVNIPNRNIYIDDKGKFHSFDDKGECRSFDDKGECRSFDDKGECHSPLRSPSKAVGSLVRGFKSSVTKRIGYPVWQRNYWEHIIRNDNAYQYIANYIINNPQKWENDKFYTN